MDAMTTTAGVVTRKVRYLNHIQMSLMHKNTTDPSSQNYHLAAIVPTEDFSKKRQRSIAQKHRRSTCVDTTRGVRPCRIPYHGAQNTNRMYDTAHGPDVFPPIRHIVQAT